MKKNDLKTILKPLIKQCIREVLFEEGALKNVVSEVVQGVTEGSQLVEQKRDNFDFRSKVQDSRTNTPNTSPARKKMLEHIGRESQKDFNLKIGGVNIFENVDPISRAGVPGAGASPHSPLSGIAPEDPGIDISRIPGMEKWSILAK